MAETVRIRKPGGSELTRAPMLRPCPSCNGQAEYRYSDAGDGLDVFAVCLGCGMRTADAANAWEAGRLWNRRTTERARLISLHELLNAEFGYEGAGGGAAVWIENDQGELRAAVLVVGIDYGETTVWEIGTEGPRQWGAEEISAEGALWRLWNWRPAEDDQARAGWNGESWRPLGAAARNMQ